MNTNLAARCFVTLLGVGMLMGPSANAQEHKVQIDFQKTNGMIRPLHGVNFGPLCYRGMVDLTRYHRELGIPYTRLHDVVWVNAEAVDIHTIFREFRNDPEKAENYNFAPTDDYIAPIFKAGSQVVFRLGESIEHTPRKYWTHPPSDPEKWAAICVGIIRHYNEGWANGFQYNIPYWEIWNEPDIGPAMWTGTPEQYFRLYEVTAKKIKERFPNVKVGGPALGGVGDMKNGTFKPSDFAAKFLAHCRDQKAPLDFFSWHRYTSNPWDLAPRVHAVRRLLDEYGFKKTESHLNEWNFLPRDDWRPMLQEGQGEMRAKWVQEMGGPSAAAFAAVGLTVLQDTPLDVGNFYTADIQCFGMFTFDGVPKKNYYAFKAFKQMLDTPLRVGVNGAVENKLAILAGKNADQKRAAVLISNFGFGTESLKLALQDLPWTGSTGVEIFTVDERNNLDRTANREFTTSNLNLGLKAKAPSVVLVKIRAMAGGK